MSTPAVSTYSVIVGVGIVCLDDAVFRELQCNHANERGIPNQTSSKG